MAKKKKSKTQKASAWESPPPSPKTAPEESVPEVPASSPLSPEAVHIDTQQDTPVQSTPAPSVEEKIDDTSAGKPASWPTAEEPIPTEQVEKPIVAKEEGQNDPTAEPSAVSEIVKEPNGTAIPEAHSAVEAESDSNAAKTCESLVHDKPSEPADSFPSDAIKSEELQPSTDTGKDAPQLVAEEQVTETASTPLVLEPEALSVVNPPASSAAAEVEAAKVDTPTVSAENTQESESEVKAGGVPQPGPTPVEVKSPSTIRAASPVKIAEPAVPKKASPTPEQASPAQTVASPVSSQVTPESALNSPRSVATERPQPLPAPSRSPPRPAAVNHAIEDSRPPAPSPPVTRVRPRHAPAFDDDEEDDLALIRPRLRGETLSRDSSRGSTYPPPSHPRALFASRVPVEHYPNPQPPPPPPPPPGYHHPRYYPPAAPPYYHNSNHGMSQSGGYPHHSPYGPPSHASHASHVSSPYQDSWGHAPQNYSPYGGQSPPQSHDSMGSREFGPPAIENGSAVEDDGDIFSRIAQAIPDLHVLLARYKETHGQLGVREELLRRADIEQQEQLRIKDQEIYTLRERLANLESKHSTEASRLRLEVGNMEEQIKDLREQLADTEKFKQEAEQLRDALDAAMKSWESRYGDLEAAHANLEKTSAEESSKAQHEFDEWKSTATRKHDAEKIALAIQFDKKLKEADVFADNQRQETAAAFVKEKDELRSEHQRQHRERDANFDTLRKELETKLGATQLDCELALKREREGMEVWAKERGTLVQAHREDIESLRKSWDEQRSLLEGQHRKIKDESDKAWIDLHAEANRKADERKALADQLTKEKEELQKQYNELKASNEREKEVVKSVAGNLEAEKLRLEKLMECYGDIAEIKSKGDTYFLVSFSQLQKQILDLAATHFMHLPVAPPPEDLAQIPSTLPSFLAETSSSRQLRAAYVAHTVSKLVTYRVFGPFLFSLGRRYDKADSLFSSMSNHIRDKSTRKEAMWRQQTLLAAFTSSGAKQRINTAAGTVVEEIVNAIKHFAAPKEEEGIKIAVKRIVKLAAETWRYARLEREMISATMPALQDDEERFTGPEYWAAYKTDGTPIPSLAGTAPPSDEKPELLLRLFPIVYREAKHENFRESQDETPDKGCIFHHGLALYSDAEPVVQRAEELRAAGLPPVTTASPTAADFPPPLAPAPRNPLPPPPEVKKASTRSKSPSKVSNKASVKASEKGFDKASEEGSVKASDKASSEKGSIKASEKGSVKPPETASTQSRSLRPLVPSESSKPPPPPVSDTESKRTKPSIVEPTKEESIRSVSPALDTADQASLRSTTSLLPPPSQISQPSISHRLASEYVQKPYTRPPPGPVDYNTPKDVPPLPAPTESVIIVSDDHDSSEIPNVPILPAPTESIVTSAPVPPSTEDREIPPLPAPTESIVTSAPVPPPTEDRETPPLPAPTESAIIPPFFPSEQSLNDSSTRDLPTPPRSRAPTPNRPISPLFAAIDEIEALTSHRSRNPSSARRSTRPKTSDEELPKDKPDTTRRTSGYSLSNRSSDQTSLRTDKTDRTERTERSSNSRYLCESRSAAIRGLYPNSPLAGQTPNLSRTNSLRSQKKKVENWDAGTWDTSTAGLPSAEGNHEPPARS